MVKALTFKGDKKPKKRKRGESERNGEEKQTGTIAEDTGDDNSWVTADAVTDVAGPILFVLPTDPPSALACDVNGKVFTVPIENIIDGNPASAEPHDVRQVWVANQVTGTESFRFRGHHSKYVAAAVSPVRLF
jgi:protein FRG1